MKPTGLAMPPRRSQVSGAAVGRASGSASDGDAAAYRGFSCPHERPDDELIELISVEYAREYIRRFIDRFARSLDRQGGGIGRVLRDWLERPLSFDDVWDLAPAGARRAVLDGDSAGAAPRAAALALRLHQLGVAGCWQLDLGKSTRLRWDNWLLPQAEWVAVDSDGRECQVRTRNGAKVTRTVLRQRRSVWHAGSAQPLLEARSAGCRFVLLSKAALDGLAFGGPLRLSTEPGARIARRCASAVTLLRRHAPRYVPWVRRVVRCIIPVHARISEIRSGSDFEKPGVIQASHPCRTVALAEMLVHEASHQYFEILHRLGPMDDGSDTALHYSPVQGRGRPLDRILLAYHAFANVMLFYRMCRRGGLRDGGYCERNEERFVPQLRQLEEPLRRSKALTPLGRALWEPLAERVKL